jgi:mono/diheme cytochrome c family protein
MSAPLNQDPRFDRAALGDDAVQVEHEKLLGPQPDERAHYRLLPLVMLFVLSGAVLFAATYLNRYSGHFDPAIYNENSLPGTGAAAAAAVDPVAFGKKIFNSPSYCVTCHQPTGQGIPGVYPPLAGSDWVNGTEDRAIRIVLYGLGGPVTVKGTSFAGAAAMPSFGTSGFNLSDDKIAAVLTYVRQEWGNTAPAVTAEKVAAIRAQVGEHKAWTADELLQVK